MHQTTVVPKAMFVVERLTHGLDIQQTVVALRSSPSRIPCKAMWIQPTIRNKPAKKTAATKMLTLRV